MSRRPVVHPGARVRWVPLKAKANDAGDAVFLASAYGLIPDDWQNDILYGWLGRRADGKWCAGKCGLAVPRQNGKNGVIEVRELFGMVELGEKILHTAHEVKTARKAFKRLKHFFGERANDSDAKFPELNALVIEVRNTNGQEAIFLSNGGSIEFVARSKGSGRGFTVDVLVLDEAQHLTDDELEAIRSAVSSAPLGNPQVIYAGTPPNRDKGELGEVFARIRAGAKKDKRLCWIEYGAQDGPLPDLEDMDLLFASNPALDLKHANGAFGLTMDVVLDERGELSPEGYARERLGWWGNPEQAGSLVDMAQWARLRDRNAEAPGSASLVLDVSLDRQWASIGVAGDAPDGRTVVLVQRKAGSAWVVPALTKLREEQDITEIALHPGGQAAVLIPALRDAGIDYFELTNKDLGQACAAFQEGIPEGRFVHVGQPELDSAVGNARTRYVGDAEQWDRRDRRIDISALVAGSTAAHRWRLVGTSGKSVYEERGLVTL